MAGIIVDHVLDEIVSDIGLDYMLGEGLRWVCRGGNVSLIFSSGLVALHEELYVSFESRRF
jgi:hypothetical protein